LIDTWEFGENNFLLGKWCEFSETDNSFKKKLNSKIIKNIYHWNDNEKKNKDYKYLEKNIEYLLEIISQKLSAIHNVQEDKKYWRVVIYTWLSSYTTTIFERWESIRIFFEKNKTEKFYSNFILFKNLDYIPRNHSGFLINTQKDAWNHLIFLRMLNFLNIPNLSLIKKEPTKDRKKKYLKRKILDPLKKYTIIKNKKNLKNNTDFTNLVKLKLTYSSK
jgi:putative transferase (TIGR04331 family)